MIKKILIYGYGSIGKKHKIALKKINLNLKFYHSSSKKLYTKQELVKIDPDLIIISTPTYLHYRHLNFFNSILKNKIILIEKPLFHKKYKINLVNNKNKVFVGYNLRYHPIIQYLKKNIRSLDPFYIRSECFSYLPNWRKKNYENNYSSKKIMGGGVANDLSHEIDYLRWLFGDIKKIFKKKIKISNLKITSDDTFILIAKINGILTNINLNFSSLVESRKLFIDDKNKTLECDLNRNNIKIYKKNSKKVIKINFINTDSLFNMHKKLLKNKFEDMCTLKDALKTVSIIN